MIEKVIERLALFFLFLLMCAARCAAQTDSIVPPTLSGGWFRVAACLPNCPGTESYAALDGFVLGGTLLASTDTIAPPSSIITAVHDGDSYYFRGLVPSNKFARVNGIDCPEVISPYVGKTQPYGREITDSVRLLLKGKNITYTLYGVDRLNRPLVSVFLNEQDIAGLILERGWGWYYSPNNLPSASKKHYKKLERAAKKKKIGLWADKDPVKPSAWRKRYPGVK